MKDLGFLPLGSQLMKIAKNTKELNTAGECRRRIEKISAERNKLDKKLGSQCSDLLHSKNGLTVDAMMSKINATERKINNLSFEFGLVAHRMEEMEEPARKKAPAGKPVKKQKLEGRKRKNP